MASLIEDARFLRMSNTITTWAGEDRKRLVLLQAAFRLYGPRVYTLCVRLLGNSDDAQDATVAVFARFNKELTRRWDEQVIVRRLRELAIDEALDRLWGRTREGLREAAMKGVTQHASAERDHVKSNVGRGLANSSLDSATVDKLIAQMADELRVVFVLHDMEGIDDRDIARHVRIRESDVRPLISRARLELRRHWLSQS